MKLHHEPLLSRQLHLGGVRLVDDEGIRTGQTAQIVGAGLDLDRPVDPALVEECLEFAVQAPTGSNRQGWRFLVVTDADKRAALGDLYRRVKRAARGGNARSSGRRSVSA